MVQDSCQPRMTHRVNDAGCQAQSMQDRCQGGVCGKIVLRYSYAQREHPRLKIEMHPPQIHHTNKIVNNMLK